MTEQDYPYSTIKELPSEMVKSWMIKFKRGVDQEINQKDRDLTSSLLSEEFDEVIEELHPVINTYDWDNNGPVELISKEKLTKELCDLIWVCYFCAHKFGLPIDAAFSRVYYSNMSKLGEDGEPLLREDGKILKSDNYIPPDLSDLFNE